MRTTTRPTTNIALALLILTSVSVSASPWPRDAAHDYAGSGHMLPRDDSCVEYCGYNSYCCHVGEVCYTSNDIAICGPQTALAAQAEGWAFYTTTYVEVNEATITKVATLSSYIGGVEEPYIAQSTAYCDLTKEIACGTLCCKSGEFCHTSGDCRKVGQNSDTFASSYLTYAPAPVPTSFSAPVRPTSLTITTVPVTTTQPFIAPVATTGGALTPLVPVEAGGGGLSPGAIAGIVIGAIAGLLLLLLLLACCLGYKGAKGIFGLFAGKKKDERRRSPRGSRTEIFEERRTTSRYGAASAAAGSRRGTAVRTSGGGWFGGPVAAGGGRRIIRQEVTEKRTRTGEAGTLAALGLGLTGMWAGLKWKRKREAEKRRPASAFYSDSYTGSSISSRRSIPRTQHTAKSHRTSRRDSRSRI